MAIIFASCWTWSNDSPDYPNIHHSIKNVRIWSYSGTHFPAFGLDTEILSISPYSVRMQENADQNKSEYGHFSRSE